MDSKGLKPFLKLPDPSLVDRHRFPAPSGQERRV